MEEVTEKNFESEVPNTANLVENYGRDVNKVGELQREILQSDTSNAEVEQELSDLSGKLWLQTSDIYAELAYIRKFLMATDSLEEREAGLVQYDALSADFIEYFDVFKSNQTTFRNQVKTRGPQNYKTSQEKMEKMDKTEKVDKTKGSRKFVKGVTTVIQRLRTAKQIGMP